MPKETTVRMPRIAYGTIFDCDAYHYWGNHMNRPQHTEAHTASHTLGKVPALTLGFWLIKIAATTLGETAGDAVTMSMNLGYLVGTAIFATILLVALFIQIKAERFRPLLFWTVIVATTTVGTTLADFCDRSLGIGYLGGSTILFALLMASLLVWYRTLGTVSVQHLDSHKAEIFYWITILFSQTLGTALGDWVADPETGWGFGYQGGALLFAAGLALVIAAYYWTRISHTILFWAAFILTRPLGATVGDFLDKPVANGGLALSRYSASTALIVCMLVLIFVFPQRAERVQASPRS
jgi:uncharacterized membrane-anchored protein